MRTLPSRLGLACACACAAMAISIATLLAPGAAASSTQESILQDDDQLLYSPPQHVEHVLEQLATLGVDRVRVTIVWGYIAPSPFSTRRPRFDATNPDAYPAGAWNPYDTLVRLAQALGVGVDFNVASPAPYWAASAAAPFPVFKKNYSPVASEFGAFMQALGKRYSGEFVPRAAAGSSSGGSPPANLAPLPRVGYWSIWNEPNEGGWLSPQWRRLPRHRFAPAAPVIYRRLVDAAWGSLMRTGHSGDTILIGETAAKGATGHGVGASMRPMPFIRALYCVDTSYHPLSGSTAAELACPRSGAPGAFAAAHPGLFQASGYGHHPYSFHLPPWVRSTDPEYATMADLPRLEGALDRIFAAYASAVPGGMPLYLTEYGYVSDPPNPYASFSAQQQAAFINEGEYMAFTDPRVRACAQFLLVDSRPRTGEPVGSRAYWSTFQTGLVGFDGKRKPAYAAYRIPIWTAVAERGAGMTVWGHLRLAARDTPQTATIEYKPAGAGTFGALRVIETVNPRGFLVAHVKVPAPGSLRLAWRDPISGLVYRSRTVRAL